MTQFSEVVELLIERLVLEVSVLNEVFSLVLLSQVHELSCTSSLCCQHAGISQGFKLLKKSGGVVTVDVYLSRCPM